MTDRNRRVVVTGIGIFSSIGCNRNAFWDALVAGRSGVGPIGAFDATQHKSRIASEVSSFEPDKLLPHKQVRRMARVSQFAA